MALRLPLMCSRLVRRRLPNRFVQHADDYLERGFFRNGDNSPGGFHYAIDTSTPYRVNLSVALIREPTTSVLLPLAATTILTTRRRGLMP